MGILDSIMETHFWQDWRSKFKLNHRKYITPQNSKVIDAVERIEIPQSVSDAQKAREVSDWIREAHKYELDKKWRTPENTLTVGFGDCEDYVFLLGSMIPHYGVDEFSIVVGEAKIGERKEYHVWLEVDGEVVDPTATRKQSQAIEYAEEMSFFVETEGY